MMPQLRSNAHASDINEGKFCIMQDFSSLHPVLRSIRIKPWIVPLRLAPPLATNIHALPPKWQFEGGGGGGGGGGGQIERSSIINRGRGPSC